MSGSMLSGWGGYPKRPCHQRSPATPDDAAACVRAEAQLIAHGMGRAYGDAALNPECTLRTDRMDRMLAFDDATGVLTCESGVLLADILDTFVPRGWFPPVTPGTQYVTVGGMLAADVHGKNQHHAGTFGEHVLACDIITADGSTTTCGPHMNNALFAATRGGMGLTGVIVRVSLQLIRIESAYVRQHTQRAQNLDALMTMFEQAAASTYTVAWIDCLARDEVLGRGVFYRGEHARAEEAPPAAPQQRTRTLPPIFPSGTINYWSARAFNALYYRRARDGEALVDYRRFFYPLDGVRDWNRIYGRRGLLQYQCVLPKAASADGLRELLETVATHRAAVCLATLKLFGPGAGGMSFPMEGYSLALDLPASAASLTLLDRLDAIVSRHGGRLYLAKDARTSPDMIRRGYPALAAFADTRAQWHATSKFISLLSQRLSL